LHRLKKYFLRTLKVKFFNYLKTLIKKLLKSLKLKMISIIKIKKLQQFFLLSKRENLFQLPFSEKLGGFRFRANILFVEKNLSRISRFASFRGNLT
jgi:hypothetical protein